MMVGGIEGNSFPAPKPLIQKKQMLRRAEKWRPYRSVAAWYLWRACDLASKSKMVLPD